MRGNTMADERWYYCSNDKKLYLATADRMLLDGRVRCECGKTHEMKGLP